MNAYFVTLLDQALRALPSGALHWPAQRLLCVSDLHLGKSDRIARRDGRMLPPYETQATLARLDADIAALDPAHVVCLGDSFDDLAGEASLDEGERLWITRLQAGRDWTWIEGNHDPGPLTLGGAHRAELRIETLVFRHIAQEGATGEVSGHYHPKCRLRGTGGGRPAFLMDAHRLILPAYGTYTGGLACTDPALQRLLADPALAILTGPRAVPVPLPRP
ncbi:ligase-associated DNA damage response endonuclease PdeM [Roseisalinus antarcticus]|uniref:Calcineurin-like phosphoesterase n=1 Tax=Roseisalinus antarcticus TaxID=254357 RepID=A0A1Y5SYC9_9RHOB|nr:ligase-associated DNA damage response endonuclease PdeM [Roseisalinus antarcticus]SLN50862.1 Calcineurin-like phosphoesterase [Roseisalinus antarcticus]